MGMLCETMPVPFASIMELGITMRELFRHARVAMPEFHAIDMEPNKGHFTLAVGTFGRMDVIVRMGEVAPAVENQDRLVDVLQRLSGRAKQMTFTDY